MLSRTASTRPIQPRHAGLAAGIEMLKARKMLSADFNHDARTDLVWHNKNSGEVVIWELENEQVETQKSLPNVPAAWDIVGFGDFNRDGDDDIFWRNAQTGENVVWLMDSESLSSSATLPAVAVDSGWQAQGVGDFNSDLRADILWRNVFTGENVVWIMSNSSTINRTDSLDTITDQASHMVGTADFNNDLHTDILWRNDNTGENVIWLMDGTDHTGDAVLPQVSGSQWRIGAVGQFTGGLDEDILWRRATDNANIVWRMDGDSVAGDTTLVTQTDHNWFLGGADTSSAVNDWNSDSQEDILWLDSQTGRGLLWYMNNDQIESTNTVNNLGQQVSGLVAVEDFDNRGGIDFLTRDTGTGAVAIILREGGAGNFSESNRGELRQIDLPAVADSSWHIVGVADFNGDEFADILWRNTATGENVTWNLVQGQYVGAVAIPTVEDSAWQVQSVHTNDSADTADIYWRNTTTGEDVVWNMSGANILGTTFLFAVEDQNWHIAATPDSDHNGYTDIIWVNDSTQEVRIWFFDGAGYSSSTVIGQVPTGNSSIVA